MMNEGKQRPVTTDARPRRVMFSYVGSTGWRRRRDIRNHKGSRKEADFSDQHHKFWSEGDDPVE
jgi:hypothetical protein